MRILIAPDKFKGSLTAIEAARAMAAGVRRANPSIEVDLCPVADGGEGTAAALVDATGGTRVTHRVTGPLPEMKVDATFGFLGDGRTAVIEMAAASGLTLVPRADRNPLATTTYGTGELIREAVRRGATRILLGIGGSATCDAGIGCAQACGFTILTRDGQPVPPTEPLCGQDLANILTIKRGRGEVTAGLEIVVASDVANPLFGPSGAAQVYGPQKGASPDAVAWLDAQLQALSERMDGQSLANTPGAGAAGGLGFGMLAYFGATVRSGIDVMLDAVGFDDRIRSADLCLIGEGRFDDQSLSGKATVGVARRCRAAGVPCVVIAGSVDVNISTTGGYDNGVTTAFSIANGPSTLDDLNRDAALLTSHTTENIVRLMMSARR